MEGDKARIKRGAVNMRDGKKIVLSLTLPVATNGELEEQNPSSPQAPDKLVIFLPRANGFKMHRIMAAWSTRGPQTL
jgi:hypothetical protein